MKTSFSSKFFEQPHQILSKGTKNRQQLIYTDINEKLQQALKHTQRAKRRGRESCTADFMKQTKIAENG